MPRLIQPSFARGELGPELYGRVDVAAYAVSLRTALNLIIHAYGGASNRAGLLYVGPCASSTHASTPPNIIEFKFNVQDTYILEFGGLYMRVIRNDAHVLNAAVVISGASAANPAVLTATGHGYSNGTDVYVDNVVGMTELNGRWFTVANATANTFELTSQQTGVAIDSSSYAAYGSAGIVSSVYEIVTPYTLAEVTDLRHVQSANVMTFVHPSHPPQELTRTDHDAWTLVEVDFKPEQVPPSAIGAIVNSAGAVTYKYKVASVNEESGEESLPGASDIKFDINSITRANPCVVETTAANTYDDGDEIEISLVVGMTELNGRRFTVDRLTATTFALEGEDSTAYTLYSSGGETRATFIRVPSAAATANNTVDWTGAAEAGRYSVYREDNGLYGFLGNTELLLFDDENISPDLAITPPKTRNPFFGSGNSPSVVSYYEQRRVFGGSDNKPDTKDYSVTGSQGNMSRSSPLQADDAITATLNSLEVNVIRAFVPMNDLLVFTSGSEWRINSGTELAFSAENLRQKPQSNWGSALLDPIVVGDKVLYVTENSAYVRSTGYELSIDGYRGNDMTVFSPHIFRNDTIVDWAFTRWPDPIINTVRSDGYAPALTFNPEQEVVAWSVWKTDGKFKHVASTRPNSDDVDTQPYFVVQRKIGGSNVYYIERTHSRRFTDVKDCFFVDSGLSLDLPKTITNVTSVYPAVVTSVAHGFAYGDEVDLSDIVWEPDVDKVFNETQPEQLNKGRFFVAEALANSFELVSIDGRRDITAVTQANPAVVTSAAHGLSNGDVVGVFNTKGMVELNGNTYKIANKTDDTYELNTLADANVDSTPYTAYVVGGNTYPAIDGSAFNDYVEGGTARLTTLTVSGAWHLEGRAVVILADGNVVTDRTVVNGQVTLPYKASRVHIGLRYIADLETLDPEPPVAGTVQGSSIRVPYITVRVKDTRGIHIGPNKYDLVEIPQREFEKDGEPTDLLTGDKELEIPADWNGGGRAFLRQIYPLPMTVSALIPYLDVGDTDEE